MLFPPFRSIWAPPTLHACSTKENTGWKYSHGICLSFPPAVIYGGVVEDSELHDRFLAHSFAILWGVLRLVGVGLGLFLAGCFFSGLWWELKMSSGVGINPGNVPVFHGSNLKGVDRKVKVAEVVLRCIICGLGVVAAVLIGTDTQVKTIFSVQKTARFTDMEALV
ncbi:hypothetical protein ACLOJK_000037 [Asimina triloba]